MKILSLGAGQQSSTIFLMGCYGELMERLGETFEFAIFADTGWETKAVYDWLEFLKSEGTKHGIQIHVVKVRNIKEDALVSQVRGKAAGGQRWVSMPYFTLGSKGERGMIRRQCTGEYKIRPIEKLQRKLLGYKPRQRIPPGSVETWKGISTDEMQRASMSNVRWIEFYYPLIELRMSRGDCLNWFIKRGLPEPPRSSCVGCPYHSNKEWRDLFKNHPEDWNEAVEFYKSIRKCGGMDGDVFIHADRIPLDQVDLTSIEDTGQLSIFREECQGVCGV